MKQFCLAMVYWVAALQGCAAEDSQAAVGSDIEMPAPDVEARDARQVTELTAALMPIVRGHNAFALDFYRQLSETRAGNLFTSALSIEAALALVQRGAAGQTAAEFKAALQMGDDEAAYHRQFGRLLRDLSGEHPGRGYQLHLANGLFVGAGFDPKPTYLSPVNEDYAPDVQRIDFGDAATVGSVNDWALDKTQGLVPNLFEYFDPSTVMVVANALYFKGDWAKGFDPKKTRNSSFRLAADATKQVPTMFGSAELQCAGDEHVRVIELDYLDRELSMLVLIPGDATDLFEPADYAPLAELEAGLGKAQLDAWVHALAPCEVRLSMPRFKAQSRLNLIETLKQLSIVRAFDSSLADFSRLTDESVYVDQALHAAYVEVDERGTRAAAASAVTVTSKSAGPDLPEFAIDQPFVFLIRDKLTESILFMGRITDPTVASQ